VNLGVMGQGGKAVSTLSARYELRLLGGFELRAPGGTPVELPTRKCELLLSYLAMPAGRAHTRDRLAGFFWSDRGEEQAKGSLRKALSALRAALGADVLAVDRDTVALRKGALLVDAEELAGLASSAEPMPAAAERFRYGEFLDVKPSASAEFEDWLSFERTRCRNLAQTVLERMAQGFAAAGKPAEAQLVAQRLLAIDGLREESHRLLMRLYADAGERSRAQAQFQACRDLLKRELGVEPSPETARLAREISVAGAAGAPAGAPIASTASRPEVGQPEAALPTDRPRGLSIAILPFASVGEVDGFLASGFSDDIITELSRVKDFLVIAPQSSFRYGSSADVAARAAGELDVRYILTGGVRRLGERLRLTVQLIDAAGDRCIWAERYDRPMADVFDVQDEIVSRIMANVDHEVWASERERAARKRPDSLDAWELFCRGMWHIYRFTREDLEAAERHFRSAVALSPHFSLPFAGLAYASFVKITWNFVDDVAADLRSALRSAEVAVDLDEAEPFGHFALGRVCIYTGDTTRATRHLTRAIELGPSFAQAYFGLAQVHFWSGRPEEALAYVDQAVRLNPKDPLVSMFMTLRAFCHYWLGDFAAAEAAARQATSLHDSETWSRLALAVALISLDRRAEARAAICEARAIDKNLSVASFDAIVGRVPEDVRQRVYGHLREAGLD
jgi:TolB-like protein/Flp pilus assembly protein TadD